MASKSTRPNAITFVVADDLRAQIQAFKQAHEIETDTETIRILVRTALAAIPEYGLVSALQAKAYNDVRKFVIREVMSSLETIKRLLAASTEAQ